MSASRSRLVQELLQQNSAILQKLKDRSEPLPVNPQAEDDCAADATNHHHPLPRPPSESAKDASVKLGLYESPQKF